MKKFYIVLGWLCCLAPQLSYAQTWKALGPDEANNPSITYAQNTSIAISPSGVPYIAYQNYAQNNEVTVKKFDGTKWITVGQPAFTDGYFPLDIFLAFSPVGTPYVTYETSADIFVRRLVGADWVSDAHFVNVGIGPTLSFTADGTAYLGYNGHSGFSAVEFRTGWQQIGDSYNISGNVSNSGQIVVAADGTPYVAYSSAAGSHAMASVKKYISGQWQSVGNAAFTNPGAGNVKMAITSDSTVYVAYTDSSNNNRITVQQFSNGIWSSTSGSFLSTGSASSLCFIMAPGNIPYLAFVDGGTNNSATVMKYVNGSWTNVGPVSISPAGADGTSITVGKDSIPYLCYSDYSLGHKVMVKKFVNGAWTDVGMGGVSPEVSTTLSLKVSPAGDIYVSENDALHNNRASVKKFSSGSWQYVGSAGISQTPARNLTMDIGPDGTPYVAYADSTQNYGGIVKKFVQNTWTQVGNAVSPGGTIQFMKLAVAPDSVPFVAYSDYGYGGKISVQKYTGSGWSPVGALGFSPGSGDEVCLFFDKNSNPFVGYINDGGYITVETFNGSAWQTVGPSDFSPPSTTSLDLAVSPDGVPYVAYFDPAKNQGAVEAFLNNAWAFIGGTAVSDSSSSIPKILFDKNGQLYTYFLTSLPRVRKLSQGVWTDISTRDITPYGVVDHRMVVTPDGNLVYAYLDPQVFAKTLTPDSLAAVPGILSCSPVFGTSGTTVNITGYNFSNATAVAFGQSAAANFTVVSPTLITAIVGNGSTGTVNVTTAYGSTSFDGFQYTAAPPVITSFSPLSGEVNSTVTINGKHFGAASATNIVRFGSVNARVISANDTVITVTVPSGANFQPITVTTNNLTAYANNAFDITWKSPSNITSSSFAAKQDFPCTQTPQALLVTDLDNDGKPDIIASYDSTTFLHNTSTIGNVNFTGNTTHQVVGTPMFGADADGDGKADVFFGSSGISVVKNNSTTSNVSFLNPQLASSASSSDFSINDIDGDGRPDIVANNTIVKNAGVADNYIYYNDPIALNFGIYGTPQSYTLADLDNDGKPDLILSVPTYVNTACYLQVLKNTSTADTISFRLVAGQYQTGLRPGKIMVADIDGDGKKDILITNADSNTITIFRNTSTGTISFDAGTTFATGIDPTGLCVADFNGDGKPDLAVANGGANTVSVFQNSSSPGTISFMPKIDFAVAFDPSAIDAADIDGDGAPDIITANYGNSISVLRNASAPINLPNTNFQLSATSATCKGTADGIISIAATTPLNYTATISGNALNSSTQFTSSGAFNNLAAGTYDVCITINGQANFQQCSTMVVTEPKDLSLDSTINVSNQSVTLALGGADQYDISLNGQLYTTADSTITLPLQAGNNELAISSDKICQGIIQRMLNISGLVDPYPVPFQNTLNVNIGNNAVDNVSIQIFSTTDGKMVLSDRYTNQSGVLQLDVSSLADGVYALHISMDSTKKIFKIIKK